MATPSSDLPFDVIFQQGSGAYQTQLSVDEFCRLEELQTREHPMIALTENQPLKLIFLAEDKAARLYMDGFEAVPEQRMAEDADGRPYLPPGKLGLFSHDTYSWIPGLYRLEVVIANGQHFALAQVLPKELTMAEWVAMRDELEGELRGLALDLTSRQLGLGSRLTDAVSPQLLQRFLLVRHYFPRVMAALADLETNVNQRVRKQQVSLPTGQPSKLTASRPYQRKAGRQTALVTRIDYDLPENRWVKYIIGQTESHLERFLASVQALLASLEARRSLQAEYSFQTGTKLLLRESESLTRAVLEQELTARKMLLGLQLVRYSRWYGQIRKRPTGGLPQALQRDGRYSALYELFRRLQLHDWQPTVDQSFRYQWKRTDRLYEIWCVIQICRALTSLQFEPLTGWLYDEDFSREESLVPDLPAGTSLTFARQRTTLRLTYDQEIPRQSSDTELPGRPVYTQDVHNRPDMRLDIYQESLFVGCIIIDCKYRPLRGFWREETLVTGYDRPKAMSQLISYGMAIRSPYLYGHKPDWAKHRSQVVLEVWALHPGAKDEDQEIYQADHRMRILCLRPGLSTDLLAKRLGECLART